MHSLRDLHRRPRQGGSCIVLICVKTFPFPIPLLDSFFCVAKASFSRWRPSASRLAFRCARPRALLLPAATQRAPPRNPPRLEDVCTFTCLFVLLFFAQPNQFPCRPIALVTRRSGHPPLWSPSPPPLCTHGSAIPPFETFPQKPNPSPSPPPRAPREDRAGERVHAFN